MAVHYNIRVTTVEDNVIVNMAAGLQRPRPPRRAFLGDHHWTYDVFLLHAGENKRFVEDLYWALCAENILPFFDAESLKLGDNADDRMEEALVRSSRFIVPIMSHQLKDKPWPEDEMKKALDRHQQVKVIIPVFYNISADKCGESTNRYFSKMARITGIEKKESYRDDEFIKLLTLRLKELLEETLEEETPIRSVPVRDDVVPDSARAAVGHPESTPLYGKGNAISGRGSQNGLRGAEITETDARAFHPLDEEDQQSLQQAQTAHVESAVRFFTKQAVENHLAANKRRIEEINRRTEELRQAGRQAQSHAAPGYQPPFFSSTPQRPMGSSHLSSKPDDCPEGSSQSYSAAGVEYVVQGQNNQVNIYHHHYHDTGHQVDET
jgi:hypothetical protein